MQILKAGVLYFGLVFGAGFVLGPIRILWVRGDAEGPGVALGRRLSLGRRQEIDAAHRACVQARRCHAGASGFAGEEDDGEVNAAGVTPPSSRSGYCFSLMGCHIDRVAERD